MIIIKDLLSILFSYDGYYSADMKKSQLKDYKELQKRMNPFVTIVVISHTLMPTIYDSSKTRLKIPSDHSRCHKKK